MIGMKSSQRYSRLAIPVRSVILALPAICAIALLTIGMARAAGTLKAAPLNPKFLKWSDETTAAVSAGLSTVVLTEEGHRLGAIPSRINRSYLKSSGSNSSALQSSKSASSAAVLAASYSSSYDLRNYSRITPVRDQSDCGSCWTFATYSSLESMLLPSKQTDFSEGHLCDTHGFDYGPCAGGTFEMAIAYLARWNGPIPENQYPYPYLSAADSLPDTSSSAVMNSYHVQDVQMITLTSDNVKAAVTTYGPVAISFYYSGTNYNSSTYGYYCSTDTSVNHAVAIIGWDDNYSKSNFNTAPSGNGAYLVRNSWGTSWGNAGYFWISYYDKSLDQAGYVFSSSQSTTNYNWIYQYDLLGETTDLGYSATTAWMANIFKGNPLGTTIKAISFYAPVNSTAYTVYIYDNVTTTLNSSSLPVVKPRTGTLAATQSGTVQAGYHTVSLTTAGTVTSGKNFSVVLKLTTPGYKYPLAVELPSSGYSSRAYALQGQSYISSNGTTWTDLTSYYTNSNVCLKAFGTK